MRVRVRFTKLGKVRCTSHRDVARMWERALRRAAVPVALTEGFSPRPKLSFGLALSTGHESLGEYLDVELRRRLQPSTSAAWPALLTPALPVGLDVLAAVAIDRRRAVAPAGRHQLHVAASRSVGADADEAAERRGRRPRGAVELVATRTRKGHDVTDDLRPAILHLAVTGPSAVGDGCRLAADLATQPRALRPAELLGGRAAPAPRQEQGAAHPPMDRPRRRAHRADPARRGAAPRTSSERAHEKGRSR